MIITEYVYWRKNIEKPAKFPHFICIAGTYLDYPFRKNSHYLNINKNDLCITEEEFIKFCRILNMWGFKNILEKIKDEDSSGFKVTFPVKNYTTDSHFLAAITIIRYSIKTSYLRVDYGTDDVIHDMFEYKKLHPKLDYFLCFQIACYRTMCGEHCPGHSCFKKVSKLVTLKELKKKFPIYTVNSLFFKKGVEGYYDPYAGGGHWRKMHDLMVNEEKEALKLLL